MRKTAHNLEPCSAGVGRARAVLFKFLISHLKAAVKGRVLPGVGRTGTCTVPSDQELPLCHPTAQPLLPPSLHSLLHSLSVSGTLPGFRTPWCAPAGRSLPPWGLQCAGVFLPEASPCCCCLPVSPHWDPLGLWLWWTYVECLPCGKCSRHLRGCFY